MMNFLGETLKGIGVEQDRMDNFNKFGVNLFMAGACETLCDTQNVEAHEREIVLADCVRVMGFKKSHAKSFSEKYEEYLMADSRYMQMFQAGRNTLNTHLEDPTAATRNMAEAIGEWNKPKIKEENSGPISVMFTDIVGSTALTQSLGDQGAQDIVRAHNRVVRHALTHNYGKEIKHTGDGIMASFEQIPDSVNAAIEMQQQAQIVFASSPNLPLQLKIGINAGEPIAEDNDLFGSTVQMAARIVDKAAANEIFISEIVRGLCEDKSYHFKDRGGYPLKGFDEDQVLYEVHWKE